MNNENEEKNKNDNLNNSSNDKECTEDKLDKKENKEEIIKEENKKEEKNEKIDEKKVEGQLSNNENKKKTIIKKEPKNFEFFKTITQDLFSDNFYNNRACIFSSYKDNNVYIVYGIYPCDLECYDVLKDEKILFVKKLHKKTFDSCRYFYDSINSKDLIITTSLDCHVKIIDFKREESEIIFDLNLESDLMPIINTACLINDKIIVPLALLDSGEIKLYNINCECTGQIKENAGFILGLNSYFCKKENKNYILVSNLEGILVFYFEDLSLYKGFIPKFEEETNLCGFDEANIIEKDGNLILLAPSFYYGYLFFWDFNYGSLICRMTLETGISDICLWDNNYFFASLNEYNYSQFVLINTKNTSVEKKFHVEDKNIRLCGIKLLRNESKGDFLIYSSITGKLDLYKLKQ